MLANGIGVGDADYCGDNDEYRAALYNRTASAGNGGKRGAGSADADLALCSSRSGEWLNIWAMRSRRVWQLPAVEGQTFQR